MLLEAWLLPPVFFFFLIVSCSVVQTELELAIPLPHSPRQLELHGSTIIRGFLSTSHCLLPHQLGPFEEPGLQTPGKIQG